MKSYLALGPRYLSANRRKTRLAVMGAAISVALITGVFSMLEVFQRFEKLQVIHDYGNYHLAISDATNSQGKHCMTSWTSSLKDPGRSKRWIK